MMRPGAPPPDSVLILKRDGTVKFASRALGGVPADEVAGTSLYDYVDPDQRSAVEECLDHVFSESETAECQLHGLLPGERDAWFECRFSPNRSAGQVPAASVVIRDITARHQREEELRRQLEMFRTPGAVGASAPQPSVPPPPVGNFDADPLARFLAAVQECGEAMFVTDAKTGRVVDANTTACRWLRMRRSDLVGAAADDLAVEFPLTIPSESDATLTDTRTARRPLIVNHGQHRRRDRSTFPVEVSFTRHTIDGGEYVLAVAREVKERDHARAELRDLARRYHAVFERTQDALILTSRDGRIEQVNSGAAALLGYPREALQGTQIQQLYVEGDDLARFRDAVRSDGEVNGLIIQLRRGDGAAMSAQIWAVTRHGVSGDIQGYQCLIQDRRAEPERRSRRVSRPTRLPAERLPPEAAEPGSVVAGNGGNGRPQATVCVLEPDEHARRDVGRALAAAGLSVLEAHTIGEALRLMRDPAHPLDLAVIDGAWAAAEEGALLETVERVHPGVPVLVTVTPGGSTLPSGFTNVRGSLPAPLHPLTVVQQVRELLTQYAE